jgi:hypothetical protein
MIYHAQSRVIIRSWLRCENCCNHEVFYRLFPSPPSHATPIAVFLHPSTEVLFHPLLSYLSLSPEHFFIINVSYIFTQSLPSLSPSFFPSMGVDPCFILSLPSHSSLILFDYLPLIPRRDGKLLCC